MGYTHISLLVVFVTFSFGVVVNSASTNTTSSPAVSTTPTPEPECISLTSCDECLKYTKCYWCNKDDTGCGDYPKGDILPTKQCPLSDARWLVCWLNFEALLISMGVIAGVLLISCCCCVYCCCCRSGRNKRKYAREDAKLESQREERKMRQEERRAERKAKNDEIRKKYGLMKDDVGYTQFENS
ncbi:pituitary tumor-transforming gene 1 protein-interacting protein-like isoform X1 [Saccoglossus kowalevskii]|uniref:Pituitary tumor-transforming gene 1 protein-interacting protein-like isoform 2 n=1 Tax=Saccoglossus kowalevskii TaxID=10224 RepID=A0ABM0GMY5_SACKO|nr:PREDICTED: pituitary tumor-transforming gene 1 protein-interacting protein-like isoform 2 [Saccoglossus kowalevskii]